MSRDGSIVWPLKLSMQGIPHSLPPSRWTRVPNIVRVSLTLTVAHNEQPLTHLYVAPQTTIELLLGLQRIAEERTLSSFRGFPLHSRVR
jgi:hypothetical protein